MNIKNILSNVDKTVMTKRIVRTATALSVGKAVQHAIRSNIPEHDNPLVNFTVSAACYVGGTVAAGFVLDTLGAYSDREIDDFINTIKNGLEEARHEEIVLEVLEGPVL